MAGNVWEWTQSLFDSYPYDPADGREDRDAPGPRVLRGGAFFNAEYLDSSRYVHCAFRLDWPPSYRIMTYGFRVVVTP
jgi:formylglycine-generating enzyme required for sulfatase activity